MKRKLVTLNIVDTLRASEKLEPEVSVAKIMEEFGITKVRLNTLLLRFNNNSNVFFQL
jgi:hypothetical protein